MYALLEDTKYLVLTTLTRQSQISASSISSLVYVSIGQVTSVLAQLERQGFVVAHRGEIDVRSAKSPTVVYSLAEGRRFNVELMLEGMRRPHRPTNMAFREIRGMITRAGEQFFANSTMLDTDQLTALQELITTAKRAEEPDLRYEVESYYTALEDCVMVLGCKDIVLAFGKLRQAYRMFSIVDPEFASFIKFMTTGIEMVIISIYGTTL